MPSQSPALPVAGTVPPQPRLVHGPLTNPPLTSLSYHAYNRGKRGITLDLKFAGDVAQLKVLANDADILIKNLRLGMAEALGTSPANMLGANPRQI